ncbi:MAG TPA: type I-E CRISPR-associated protein Cas5/CasD [Pseudonocardiaceae bacterium]|jgi:CRISPR system Cascade subunit CasD|nr:type I-E CRISPR-associated protein Cas5/CasD [Pseudonocardiaceae bacterium]
MTVLLLRLAAPLQSWGTSSRFVRRTTDRTPSKSGIIGLLAAAQGRRRTDTIEDLLHLRIGVRIEQPGRLERDFQTARPRDGSAPLPLSYRFYLADAVFLTAIQAEQDLLEGFQQALRRPAFPLFLGRRSCPPAGRLDHGLREGDIDHALDREPWQAAQFIQRAHRAPQVTLNTVVDCPAGTPGADLVRDDPLSFDPRHRDYGWRSVRHRPVHIPNPHHQPTAAPILSDAHDPMAALGGAP